MLKLVTGPASAGKTGVLHREMERVAHTGSPVLALPGAPDIHRAQEEFARKRVYGIRVVQLDRWIGQLWTLHGDGRRLVTPVVRGALVDRALAGSAPASGISTLGTTIGYRDLIGRVVLGGPRAILRDTARGTAAEVATVCETYWQLLTSQGYIEQAEAALALGRMTSLGLETVAVNRFTDLSWSQEAFLVSLAASADVTISLTWEAGLPATQALDPLVERLVTAGARHIEIEGNQWVSEDLDELARRLYQGPRLAGGVAGLELIAASGPRAESAAVATRAAELVAAGEHPRSIAIVARDMCGRADELEAALGAVGVQASVDVVRRFRSTGFGGALLGLLEAQSGSERARESLLAFVLSPYSGVDPAEASDADRAWRQRRLTGHDVLRAATRLPEMAKYGKLLGGLERCSGAGQWMSIWQELGARMLSHAHTRRGLGGPQGRADAAAFQSLCDMVSELGDAGIVPDRIEALRHLDALKVSPSPIDGGVVITEAHRVRGLRFSTVFLMGMTAAEFSTNQPRPLADIVLDQLGAPARPERSLTERLVFYSVITRARTRLVMSRQASDERGEAIRPSVFWEEVTDLVTREENGREAVTGLSEVRDDVLAHAPVFTPGRAQMRLDAALLTAPVIETVAPDLDTDDREYSVSEIESYIACPRRWFLDRALRPRTLDRVVDASERGTYVHGLLKAFYDQWAEGGEGRVNAGSLDRALEVFESVRAAYVPRVEASAGIAEEVAMVQAARWARAVVVDDADFLPGFEPAGHEVGFGTAAGHPFQLGGISLQGRIDRVELARSGVVAIDYKSSSAVRGVGSFGTYGLLQATVYAAAAASLFGLPPLAGVYRSLRSMAVRGVWREGTVDLGTRGSDRDAVTAEGLAAEIDRASTMIGLAVEGMRAGEIGARPLKRATCQYCQWRGVCEVR